MPSAKPRETLVRLEELSGSGFRIETSGPKCMTDTMSGLNNFELIRRGVLRLDKASELLDITDDYASILHAHLDLMQILHNAHSILYSSNERTQSMINEGDYPRYLDDLMEAATAWSTNWGGLQVSPKLKLTEAGSYGLYAAVFLYKALNAGAIRGHAQQKQVRGLSQAFILTLDEVASTEPHICHGYSVLLRELWQQDKDQQVESGPEVQHDQGTHKDHSSAVEDTILGDPSTWGSEGSSQPIVQGLDRVNQPLAGSSSSSAEAVVGTQGLLSFENYLFKSMWPEVASPEHQGDFYDLEGELLGFDMDPLSEFEPL
ncbi:uncharacterized protein CCOS01_06446 [Colletotrichum costaricense]|uniref:Fungal specific transcription factor n=1 Tax=Colletotrichum costaricense TaxID=1209916 RepID=A0AAJ0E1U3_9PEZI|nr:uncharacterized protein CCOS01_06446 [Colletotrichum costaricense]KAK1528612.1 hypothetical protein CCOS01_06446 [Colletotrichum costaricense]